MDPCIVRSQAPSRIRAFVVSKVRLYREGIESALGRRDAIDVVGTAGTMAEAIDRVAIVDPAIVVVDIATRDSLAGILRTTKGFRDHRRRAGKQGARRLESRPDSCCSLEV